MIFAGNVMAIQTIIQKKFPAPIWRTEIDELTDTLVLELRDASEKQVRFASINLVNGQVYFDNFAAPERWLTGVEAAYDRVFLLHFFQSENGPSHKGLMAVDASTQNVLWSNFNYTFDYLSTEGPVLYDARVQPRKLFLANIRTGTIRPIQGVLSPAINSIVLPVIKTLAELPPGLLPLLPIGNMTHYLEHNNRIIVSLHAQKGNVLVQALYVLTGTATGEYEVIYEDLLNDGIQKLQPEAFIMHKNRLIYIKNRSELKVLNL